jgi:hypothetical protein
MIKKCIHCNEIKVIALFRSTFRYSTGDIVPANVCKKCYQEKNKKCKERYRLMHPDKVKESNSKYRKKIKLSEYSAAR